MWELKSSEAQIRNLIDNAPFPIILSGVGDGAIRYCNHRAEKLFNIARNELVKSPAERFYQNPEDRGRFRERVRAEGSVYDQEIGMIDGSGRPIVVLMTGAIVEYEHDDVYFISFNDITSLKATYSKLRGSNRELAALKASGDALLKRPRSVRIHVGNLPRAGRAVRLHDGLGGVRGAGRREKRSRRRPLGRRRGLSAHHQGDMGRFRDRERADRNVHPNGRDPDQLLHPHARNVRTVA